MEIPEQQSISRCSKLWRRQILTAISWVKSWTTSNVPSAGLLENLPAEIFERVVIHLDLTSIRQLRLCSRTIAIKATQQHFRSYFDSKQVEMTEDALLELIHMTKPGQLGHEVQNLTIIGITEDMIWMNLKQQYGAHVADNPRLLPRDATYIYQPSRQRAIELLTVALANLKAHGDGYVLHALGVEVFPCRAGVERRPAFDMLKSDFVLGVRSELIGGCTRALVASGLKLKYYNPIIWSHSNL